MAFDLDGTLLDPTGRITNRVAVALRAAHDAGITLALATGRPPFMLGNLINAVGPAITHGVMANGAIVCTFPDGTPLRTLHFDIDVAVDTIHKLRLLDAALGIALATDAGFAAERGFSERMPIEGNLAPVADAVVASVGATIVVKLMVFHPRLGAHELIDLLGQHVGAGLEVFHMGAEAVEIGPAGVDKAAGLQWLCAHLGIDSNDVMVFGDNTNDHTMLEWAGRGVAMGNAAPRTKALADFVALPNDEDGVAVFIEELLRG
jgi:Cof subfamily protein (haloacid dehalogenase superfamily)